MCSGRLTFTPQLKTVELPLELKLPELEPELGVKPLELELEPSGVGVETSGVGVETSGVGVGVELKPPELELKLLELGVKSRGIRGMIATALSSFNSLAIPSSSSSNAIHVGVT